MRSKFSLACTCDEVDKRPSRDDDAETHDEEPDAPVLEPMSDKSEDPLRDDDLWRELIESPPLVPATQADKDADRREKVAEDPWAVLPCRRIRASGKCVLSVCEVSPRIVGVRVEGVFGGGRHGGARLEEEVRRGMERGASDVLLDFSSVSALRMDSAPPLVACQVNAEGAGGRMAMVTPPGAAGGLIVASGVADRVECFDNVTAALAYLSVLDEDKSPS